jgi:2-polyprenyl-3-methyl-5-hydroxy-6-metoxy-1,4-benzoquinol methylase
MSYGWINARNFSFYTLLLMDRWIFRIIADNRKPEFEHNMGIALAGNPAVYWYIVHKCPECLEHYKKLMESASGKYTTNEVRASEVLIIDDMDWAVVYVYPELIETLPYIRDWDKERLLSITDFRGKTVLDIGSGTGRLAFAAAGPAKIVYASEPVDRLREYLREKQNRLKVDNLYVVDGSIELLPFPNDFFDIVMSGHVIGSDHEAEWWEMSRVTKPGG